MKSSPIFARSVGHHIALLCGVVSDEFEFGVDFTFDFEAFVKVDFRVWWVTLIGKYFVYLNELAKLWKVWNFANIRGLNRRLSLIGLFDDQPAHFSVIRVDPT